MFYIKQHKRQNCHDVNETTDYYSHIQLCHLALMAPIIYMDTIKQDLIIFTPSTEHIISNTKQYNHLHAKHNSTRVITMFFEISKEL